MTKRNFSLLFHLNNRNTTSKENKSLKTKISNPAQTRHFPLLKKKNVIKKKIALFNEGTIETEQIVIAAVTSYLIYILHFS